MRIPRRIVGVALVAVLHGLSASAFAQTPAPEHVTLTPEQMEAINSLGSWDEIMEALKDRLAEQQGRHQGGNKWIGTGGTSPFGHPRRVGTVHRSRAGNLPRTGLYRIQLP